MDINQRNIRIDSALRAAVKIGALDNEEYESACRLITAGENAAFAHSEAAQAPYARWEAHLMEAVELTIETLGRQLDLIAERAPGSMLDKAPVVRSLTAHKQRLERAVAERNASFAAPVAPAAAALTYPTEFTDELQWILGLICFQCITYAQTLRKGGRAIPTKAEAEQAAVLDWMLRHYLRDPENWRKTASDEMRAIDTASSAGDQEGGS